MTYLEEILKIRTMMGLNEDSTPTSSTSTSTSTSTGSLWDSGAKRGPGNPVGNTTWQSNTTRGPGNPLEEGDKLESFAETRLGGAEKIADNAKEKGGAALLTYHHFEVKLEYYEKAAKGDLDMGDAKKEYKDLLEKLYTATKGDMDIEQIAFQELLGKMEVLGELIIKDSEKPQ
jgi:hypothetical protein